MRKTLCVCLLIAACLLPAAAKAGPVADTMRNYAIGGAALGALLGGAVAVVPYLNDKQSFDFIVGGGMGALSGAGVGLILGAIDAVQTRRQGAVTLAPLGGQTGLVLLPNRQMVTWTRTF